MENARKKDLIREYKERKQTPGIFAVRCGDQVWVGATKNLDKQQNALWFQLKGGIYTSKPMQAAWNAKGESAFTYEVLEEIADDNAGIIALLLKERDALWREQLDAGKALS